jgi:catechol 2,3-dioxygenase-like lactoylglutathione lyase family enzyme
MGADVPVFDDSNVATYMAPYMGGKPRAKRAILAMNMQGGSGYEIWQYLERRPAAAKSPLQIGDLGINVAFVKTRDVEHTYQRLQADGEQVLTQIQQEPGGGRCFYLADPYGNWLKVAEYDAWYANGRSEVGGIFGCAIGVTDIETSLGLYRDVLGYDQLVCDETGVFSDLDGLRGGTQSYRRVRLTHGLTRSGGFSDLFGPSELELIQCLDRQPTKVFADRYWGDLGFIHLCFDIRHMQALVEECAQKGFPFRVLSAPEFDMGGANGHWGYLEDPDGTLIEFVETHRVPIVAPLGLNIDLTRRDPRKPLPSWLIKALSLKRVKKFK